MSRLCPLPVSRSGEICNWCGRPGTPPAAVRLRELVKAQEEKKAEWVMIPIEDAKELLE